MTESQTVYGVWFIQLQGNVIQRIPYAPKKVVIAQVLQ